MAKPQPELELVWEYSESESKSESEAAELHIMYVTNKENTKVLFAEAGYKVTGLLLSFLLLPLGTVVKVLEKRYGEKAPVIGSLSTLYKGVEKLDSIHFPTEDSKSLLLNPARYGGDECPKSCGVFTTGTAPFIISDDLRVMPNVESSIVNTLNNLGIAMKEMDGAQTRTIAFGYNEILGLLRASLLYRNPLTVFLLGRSMVKPIAGQGSALIDQISKKAMLQNSKKMILKVMVQKSTAKFLFAQAHNDFISFLFGLLAIPLGRVGWYLHSNTGLRTLDNLHKSVVNNLYKNHLMSAEDKNLLYKPGVSASDDAINEFKPLNFDRNTNLYHVRGPTTYMVSDDLTVSPLSLTSSISVLKLLKISFSDVQEMECQVGLEEGLSIMKAALTSTTALTDGLIKPLLKKQTKQENSDFEILDYGAFEEIKSYFQNGNDFCPPSEQKSLPT